MSASGLLRRPVVTGAAAVLAAVLGAGAATAALAGAQPASGSASLEQAQAQAQEQAQGSSGGGDPSHPPATAGAPNGTTGSQAAQRQLEANRDPAEVRAGEELFLTSCVNCHGVGGVGTPGYPSLVGVGAAGADFYLRTGRMPLAFPGVQPPEKPPAFTDDQIVALVAYVASLGDGPAVPDVDATRGDLSEGASLFLANCAACHNAAAAGGALSYGRHAPDLQSVRPTQIGEAVRVGPGDMPVFGPRTLSDDQIDSIARYVEYLHEPENPGGLRIGSLGPVPEGFVAWLVGLSALVIVARWITRERHARRPR